MIKAILIDVDNTLLDFNKCAFVAMQTASKHFGIILPKEVETVFHNVNDELWLEIEKNRLTREELHQTRWKIIFKRCNINFDGEKFEKVFVSHLKDTAIPVDGAFELLDYLTEKYPVYVASNATANQQRLRLKTVNMIDKFSGIFLSEEIGAEKPSKEFFSFCTNKIGVNPSEIVMIGDSLSADVKGAKAYNIKTIWYNHNKNQIPDIPCFDFAVNSLKEIKNIL